MSPRAGGILKPGRGGGVRLTGGAFRGRAVAVPPGARPTEGRVREALFSIWCERLDACRFLDLFAGSGAVGLEAAGRGALRVLCIDQDQLAVRAIVANAAKLGEPLLETRRLALPAGLASLAAAGAGPFDLVFADPPYRFDAFEPLLLGLPPLLAAGAEIAVEYSSRRDLPVTAGPLVRTDLRRYGESALAFYRAPEKD
jgi:16S rRNA (guanine966-N2)-methyltransferase